eukprot:9146042-Pyramimonas_sp.AAC.1
MCFGVRDVATHCTACRNCQKRATAPVHLFAWYFTCSRCLRANNADASTLADWRAAESRQLWSDSGEWATRPRYFAEW